MRDEPALLGILPARVAAGEIAAAIDQATEALKRQREARPTLFWSSRTNQAQVRAWMRRAFVGRDADEISGLVDRANEPERWSLRHECARRIIDRGDDVDAVRNAVEEANPLHSNGAPVQRAVAQTPDGKIAGYARDEGSI